MSRGERIFTAAVCLVAALAIVIVSALRLTHEDSGVEACRTLKDNAHKHQSGADAAFTADEYYDIRAVFAASEHDDIRNAGTRFVDVSWQLASTNGKPDNGAALLYSTQLIDAYTDLVGACTAQDVSLPTLEQLSRK